MSNANRDYVIVYDVKNSSLVLSRPLNFYITDKNTSNIFVKLVTRIIIGNGMDQYVDIENASNYVLTMRVVKPNNEVKSIEATQHEPESIFQFDLTEDFKDVPGKYMCELIISAIVSGRQELTTSDPFSYEVKRSVLSNIGEIVETEDTTVEKLLNNLDVIKAELSLKIKEIENDGVTKETVEAKVQSVIEEKIEDGTMANLTLADNSITNDKIQNISLYKITDVENGGLPFFETKKMYNEILFNKSKEMPNDFTCDTNGLIELIYDENKSENTIKQSNIVINGKTINTVKLLPNETVSADTIKDGWFEIRNIKEFRFNLIAENNGEWVRVASSTVVDDR